MSTWDKISLIMAGIVIGTWIAVIVRSIGESVKRYKALKLTEQKALEFTVFGIESRLENAERSIALLLKITDQEL